MTPSPGIEAAGGAVRLADWGVIRASGADARSFLHSQLTQDMRTLSPGQARLAGYCSPKGRLLASFVVWTTVPDEVLLACSADLLAPTLKRLSMFVLRARCKLSDASAEVPLWGLADAAAQAWHGAATAGVWKTAAARGGTLIELPSARVGELPVPRWLWAAPFAGDSAGDSAADSPELDAMPLPVWSALEASSGVVRIVAATSEKFVPQMVNLELVGGVDFQKGCYPGQEIVARSQYRGTLKRRAYVLSCAELAQPGAEVFHSDDPAQPAGMVALAGTLSSGRHVVLAELKIAATHAGALHLGGPQGALLQRAELPYEIPLEAA